ncbi:protoporphyrinogen/coproporphyrinogen oxidase [Desertivirga brevis]|uniref:protoporphyrinogen/coproporphyrinogen oxidase n=1 Tax=Desertivirga brevis TaxID=2810310 RepID=UPI001A9644D6|nr:NAD(P)-binding protein [Pedobacter sp. SYSU D00873]
MRVGILGAGISGLSLARFLKDSFHVEVLESKDEVGGIARTLSVDGFTYHPVGGHCFNSKHSTVLNFVFDQVLAREDWNVVTRDAAIKLGSKEVNYPIEYSVREIAEHFPEMAAAIIADFKTTSTNNISKNLEEWFRNQFGNTLSEIYFLPYSRKIWDRDPSEIDPSWVEGKLPIPDRESFLRSLNNEEHDHMAHRHFFYPKTNNQNTFIDRLAVELNITRQYKVTSIRNNKERNTWTVNGEKEFEILISTIPLNRLPEMIMGTPQEIIEAAGKLKYNKVTTMLWTSGTTNKTWTYIPEKESIFHRYIHIGNYFTPKQDITITESIGERSYEEMKTAGEKDPFLVKPLAYHVSDHAYVVFDKEYKETTKLLKDHFRRLGIQLLGRFGEWEYLNMDECINRSLHLSIEIKKRLQE